MSFQWVTRRQGMSRKTLSQSKLLLDLDLHLDHPLAHRLEAHPFLVNLALDSILDHPNLALHSILAHPCLALDFHPLLHLLDLSQLASPSSAQDPVLLPLPVSSLLSPSLTSSLTLST